MNVTKEVITDLFPLYAANECSKDSRALVELYLRDNPDQALVTVDDRQASHLNVGPVAVIEAAFRIVSSGLATRTFRVRASLTFMAASFVYASNIVLTKSDDCLAG